VNTIPFRCDDCKVYFRTSWDLKFHQTKTKTPCVKPGTFKFMCGKCAYRTNLKWLFDRHQKKQDCTYKCRVLQCEKCDQVFERKTWFDTHIKKDICAVPLHMKKCNECKTIKVLSEFFLCKKGHKQRQEKCKDCSRCPHGKFPGMCTDVKCRGDVIPRKYCVICTVTKLGKNRYETQICAGCSNDMDLDPMERAEIKMKHLIEDLVDIPSSEADRTIASSKNCAHLSKRRPDIVFVVDTHLVIVVEIDEDSHSYRPAECEMAKISEQNEAIQLSEGMENCRVITLRVNPDKYHGGDFTLDNRAFAVARRIIEIRDEYQLMNVVPRDGYMRVEYFYYHERAYPKIEAQKSFTDVLVFP